MAHRVHLTVMGDGSVLVRDLKAGGHVRDKEVIVQPGGSYMGFKASRLKRLGNGEHELLTKEEREKTTDSKEQDDAKARRAANRKARADRRKAKRDAAAKSTRGKGKAS